MFKKIVFSFLVLLIILSGCKTVNSDNYNYEPTDDPAEYTDEEFYDWLHAIRRTEIIFAGAFPVAMIFTTLGTFAYTSATQTEIQDDYLELKIGLSVAGGVALTDFILGLIFKDE